MKKIFVLGDSISIHYGPFLEEYLQGIFEYDRKGKNQECKDLNIVSQVNGGDSGRVLEYLQLLPDLNFDILLLNCGLHDIKTCDGVRQVSEEAYRKNLLQIIDLVHNHGKKIVWVTSTPVDDELHNRICQSFKRYNADLVRYNEIALKVTEEKQIPVIDLYGFTNRLNIPLYQDNVHFLEPVRKLQAAFIAGHLMALEQSSVI